MKQSVFVMAILLIFNSCKNDESNPIINKQNDNYLMDLTIGKQWNYQFISYDTSGNIYNIDTISFKIVRDTLIQNEKWYFIGDSIYAIELLSNQKDGLWYMRLNLNGTIEVPPALFAKYPVNESDVWLADDSSNAIVLSKDTSITVINQTYSCYKYAYKSIKLDYTYRIRYFSHNVGMVRFDELNKSRSGNIYVQMRRDIISTSMNKYINSYNHSNNKRLLYYSF